MFAVLKSKLLLIGGSVLAVLLGVMKWLLFRNSQLKERAKKAEAKVNSQEIVNELDSELSSDLKSHKAEIANRDKDEPIEDLENPNDWG